MRTPWGPLTRLLISNIVVMAVVSGVISTFALITIQLINRSMQQVHDVSDSAALSSRMRSECLDLTDLVRRYTAGSADRSDLKLMISTQQQSLLDLISQAQGRVEQGNLEQAQQVAALRESLVAFSIQATRVLEAVDQNQNSSSSAQQELSSLIQEYQDPLIAALQDYENAQDSRADAARSQTESLISGLVLVFLLINLLVIAGGVRMVRQMVVRVAQPLSELRAGVENFRRGQLDPPIAIQTQDEVGLLAEAFNILTMEVRESRGQLEEYAHSLESQVAARTREAEQRADQAAQLYQEVQQLAIIDSLTGVFNRRYLFEQAAREFDRAVRYHQSLALILFDIDHFKQINDHYGHPTGDQVLTGLCQACHEHLRVIDLIGRYGGEEFLILMPETDEIEAFRVAERLRREVEKIRIPAGQHVVQITISLGVAALIPSQDDHLDALIKRTDDALYAAKRAGRNRVEITIDK